MNNMPIANGVQISPRISSITGIFWGAHANLANPAKGLDESIMDMTEYKKCLYDKIKAVF